MKKLETIEVSNKQQIFIHSTSKGNQRKWKVGDLWVKEDYLGYEGIAEELCYNVIKLCDIPLELKVPYFACNILDLDTGEITTGCYSPDFSKGETHQTLYSIMLANNLTSKSYEGNGFNQTQDNFINLIKELTGLSLPEYVKQLIAIDALLVNEDRHLNNILFLLSDTGEVRPSPYFDFGLSLLSDTIAYTDNSPITHTLSKMKPRLFTTKNLKVLKEYNYSPILSYEELMLFIGGCDYSKYGRALDVLRVSSKLNKDSKIFIENHKEINQTTKRGITNDFRAKD